MNGRGDNSQDKWGSINNVMRKRRIAILSLQEMHPTDEMKNLIAKRFRNTLHIVHSADPKNPGTVGGVSIAVHKSLIEVKKHYTPSHHPGTGYTSGNPMGRWRSTTSDEHLCPNKKR
jgi:hypothetical protein